MKKLMLMALVMFSVSACSHKKVSVSQFDDKDKSCSQLAADIQKMEDLEKDIDSKTGLSGRNVGMALLFWPGIIVNEMNADDARDRASDRKERLMSFYSKKKCS